MQCYPELNEKQKLVKILFLQFKNKCFDKTIRVNRKCQMCSSFLSEELLFSIDASDSLKQFMSILRTIIEETTNRTTPSVTTLMYPDIHCDRCLTYIISTLNIKITIKELNYLIATKLV